MVCFWHGGRQCGAGWSGAGGDRGSGAAIPTSPSANPEQIQLTDGVFAPHNHPGLEKVRVWGEYHPELEMTPHLEERMEERDFTEIDVREMLEGATAFAPDVVAGRFVIEALLRGRHWQIIVEPDPDDRLLVVVTAYRPS